MNESMTALECAKKQLLFRGYGLSAGDCGSTATVT